MKTTRRIIGLFIIVFMVILLSAQQTLGVNLVPLKRYNGSNLKYRNTNTNVYIPDTYVAPAEDFRAVWVTSLVDDITIDNDSTYKKNYTAILDHMEEYNMNAIIYHVRIMHDALYNSELNVKSTRINGLSNNWDSLEWLISEAHKRGIEFHAWLNPYRISNTPAKSVGAVTSQYKAPNPASKAQNILIGDRTILNPGEPEVRDFLVDTCMELIENYDIDAIHFDDYFYTSGINDTATRNKYNPRDLEVDDWRREQVNLFIEDLSNTMRAYNIANDRYVQLGISPTGIYKNGTSGVAEGGPSNYNSNGDFITNGSNTAGNPHFAGNLYADTKKWIDNEWIDYILPQIYWGFEREVAPYADIVDWWAKVVRKKKVNFYTGTGLYMATSGGSNDSWTYNEYEASTQILYNTKHPEVKGQSFYSYRRMKSLENIIIPGMNRIKNEYWTKKALLPVIHSLKREPLARVKNAALTPNQKGITLTWDALDKARGYAIYRSTGDINFADTSQIIDILGFDDQPLVTYNDLINNSQQYNYGIRAIDGANQLGEGVVVNYEETPPTFTVSLHDNLNKSLLTATTFEVERGEINTIFPKTNSNYNYHFLTQNGKIISEDNSYDYLAYRDEEFVGYFTEKNKIGVAFVSQNNDLIDYQIVDDPLDISPPSITPPLEGYEFSHWSTPLEDITTNTIVKAIFEKVDKDVYTINYNDGSGAKTTTKKYAEKFILTPHPSLVEQFSHWEVDGKIYSFAKTLVVTIYSDTTIKASYTFKNAEPLININNEAISFGSQIAFLGSYYLPDEYVFLETGIVVYQGKTTRDFDLATPDVLSKAAAKISETNEYAMILPNVNAGDVNCARMYLRYLDGDRERIIYSDIITHTNVTPEFKALQSIVDSIPKHITDDYEFPSESGLTFVYKEGQDQSLFDLNNGKLLIRRLTTQVRTITATLGDVSIDFDVNFGIVGVEQEGSFYKNNPAHLLETEGEVADVYGWSGYTMTKEDKVHFITHAIELDGNGLITDTSILNPDSEWISLGTLYINTGSQAVRFTLSSLGNRFDNGTNTRDVKVIIAADGEIKELMTRVSNLNREIVLQPGESFWVSKYLDRVTDHGDIYFGTVNDFSVGSYVEINKYWQ